MKFFDPKRWWRSPNRMSMREFEGRSSNAHTFPDGIPCCQHVQSLECSSPRARWVRAYSSPPAVTPMGQAPGPARTSPSRSRRSPRPAREEPPQRRRRCRSTGRSPAQAVLTRWSSRGQRCPCRVSSSRRPIQPDAQTTTIPRTVMIAVTSSRPVRCSWICRPITPCVAAHASVACRHLPRARGEDSPGQVRR
jgi:hypothetical protein